MAPHLLLQQLQLGSIQRHPVAARLPIRLSPCRSSSSFRRLTLGRRAATAATSTQAAAPASSRLPRTAKEMVQQAADVVSRAQASTSEQQQQRLLVEFLNPVNEKEANFMAINTDDYPCSNMKEFETLVGLTRTLLSSLGYGEGLKTTRIDEGGLDGDLCATVSGSSSSSSSKRAVAVVWPTAEKLKQLKALAEDGSVWLLLIVNPLWKTEGLVVSEFGVGPWRKANEAFVATFLTAYQHLETRVGAPSSVDLVTGTRYVSGAILRVLRAFPDPWMAHVVSDDGSSQPIGTTPARPSYKELEALVDAARKAKLEIFMVARAASSLDREAGVKSQAVEDRFAASDAGGGADAGEATAPSFPTQAALKTMDPKAVRRLLVSLGLPGAGTPQKLVARAVAIAQAVEAGQGLQAGLEAARRLR